MATTTLAPTKIFELLLKELGIRYKKEYKFHPTRKFRFDYAVVEKKVGFEVDGGIFPVKNEDTGKMESGRHLRPIGFCNDCYKQALAFDCGWKMLRIPSCWLTHSPVSAKTPSRKKHAPYLMPLDELKQIIINLLL